MDSQEVKFNRGYVERGSWLLVLIGILAQLNASYSFPANNIILGFWGVFCSISKHGRATLGLVVFLAITILLDIIYCSTNSGTGSGYRFALAMLIIGLLLKAHILFYSMKYFASLGGQYSLGLDESVVLDGSGYSSLGTSGSATGGYFPPTNNSQTLAESGELKNSVNLGDSGMY